MYVISYYLRNVKPISLMLLSKGTVVILGFHGLFIRAYDYLPTPFHTAITDYFISLVIILSFIPIIRVSERFFPVLIGTRVNTLK